MPEVDVKLLEGLCSHTWPGNVRELELLTRRLLALREPGQRLKREHLPFALADEENAGPSQAVSNRRESELSRLVHALQQNGAI